MAEANADCNPGAAKMRVEVVADAGHAVHEERAEALVPLVRRFAAVVATPAEAGTEP